MQNITATIGKDHYQTVLTNSRHQIIADEPKEYEGTDLGPNPHELLMMSLASCTAITLRMYADRKKWEIEQIIVEVNYSKEQGKNTFNRQISVVGSISEDEKTRLLHIANACPVHKTLTHPIEINTTLL